MATKKEAEQQKSSSKSTQEETASSKAAESSTEADVSRQLDELVQTLQADLSSIDTETSLSLIDQWHSFLTKTKDSGYKELAGGLKDLQKMLKGGKATGHEISEALIHIGEQTTEIASDGEKEIKQPIQKLGKQLRNVGTSLAKAEDKDYHDQLDSLLEKADAGELTSLKTDEANSSIDFWYNILHKSEDESVKSIASSLKSLKQALGKSNAKPETIAKALAEVGSQTKEAVAQAPRGFKGVIQKLGKQIESASESLTAKS
jgi:F0F1-type ATP synthase membrane subunit b/b'